MRSRAVAVVIAVALAAGQAAAQRPSNPLIELWRQNKVAFGVFVPNEAPPPQRPPQAGATGATGATGAAGAAGGDVAGRGRGQGPRPKPVYTEAGGQKLAANPLYDY